MIKNVLTFARGQENRLAIAKRAMVPDEVVRATLATHAPALAQAKLALETDLDAGVEVMADPDALEQIASNLLSNVEKYARVGGWVKVTTRYRDGELTLRVADRGPGIPPGQREQVFEPFWRASDKLSDGVTGTGIGLDIARRLARLHGGDVRVVDGQARRGADAEVSEIDGEGPPGATFELTVRAEVFHAKGTP
jgi:signal transduction histidine kinase